MASERIVIGRLGTKRLLAWFLLLGALLWLVPWLNSERGLRVAAPFLVAWGGLAALSLPYVGHLTAGRGVGLWIEGGRLHFPHGSAPLDEISAITPTGRTIFTDLPDYMTVELRGGRRSWFSHAVFRTPYPDIVARLRAQGLLVREFSASAADDGDKPR